MKRKVNKIVCKICNNEYSTVGFFGHLRDTHQTSPDEYVKQHGEYRTKVLSLKNYESADSNFECLLDGKKFKSERMLSGHIKRNFNMSKNEYVKNVVFKDGIPKCKCGCGDDVGIIKQYPYKREYISGHNSVGETNPMYGKTHSVDAINTMIEKANSRVELYRENKCPLPMHSKESLIKRGLIYSNKMMNLKQIKYNVEILERNGDFLRFKCLKCNKEHSQYHTSYFTCSNCYPPIKSKGENDLKSSIETTFNIECVQNYRKLFNGTMECDIFIPSKNIGIEYNGIYYHSEFSGNKHKNYHIDKTNSFLNKGVKILHVFEDEWLNKRDIILSRIGSYIGKYGSKHHARECVIKEVSINDSRDFLTKNHLQGSDKHQISYGLYKDGCLLSIMTFSKLNISKGSIHIDGHYELSRFCNLLNTSISGAFSKLLKHFIKNNTFEKLITYADMRWSDQTKNVYIINGFNFVSKSSPNYFYTKDHKNRLNRFGFRKSELIKSGGDPSKTEIQIMREMGYDRIWDCGHLKYELLTR